MSPLLHDTDHRRAHVVGVKELGHRANVVMILETGCVSARDTACGTGVREQCKAWVRYGATWRLSNSSGLDHEQGSLRCHGGCRQAGDERAWLARGKRIGRWPPLP
jgi:hypothetical protein